MPKATCSRKIRPYDGYRTLCSNNTVIFFFIQTASHKSDHRQHSSNPHPSHILSNLSHISGAQVGARITEQSSPDTERERERDLTDEAAAAREMFRKD